MEINGIVRSYARKTVRVLRLFPAPQLSASDE